MTRTGTRSRLVGRRPEIRAGSPLAYVLRRLGRRRQNVPTVCGERNEARESLRTGIF